MNKKKAVLKYKPNDFDILEEGDHVICAVSKKIILLENLNYWNVELQEAYYSPIEAKKKYVCQNQIKKGLAGVKDSINYIKNNFSIALMIDQRVSEGNKLPFFDHLALTTTLPAQMALKFKLDIVPIYIARKTNDNFEIEIYDPIKNFSNDDYESNKLNISIKLNKILEEMISRDPGQWIWTHNRWK